jgi:hypothetical protein
LSQRPSGYARQEADNYATPAWVTRALIPHIPPRIKTIWEPAAGEGAMANVLRDVGFVTIATDLRPGNGMPTAKGSVDFLNESSVFHAPGIVTNPPFHLAQEFIERALELTRREHGFVAMLLRADFDHAKSRRFLFDDDWFAKRLVLTRRIVWFVDPLTGKPKASPSVNHSWWIWDWTHRGPATIAYYVESSSADKIDRVGVQGSEGAGRQDPDRAGQEGADGQAGRLDPAEGGA